jgi:hypothetical protein
MTAFEFENIAQVLDTITDINIMPCCSTTYDHGLAEAVKHKIIRDLAKHYGVTYNAIPQSAVTFPVDTHEKIQRSF